MDIPAKRWYEAIQIRKSRRNYLDKPLDNKVKNSLISFLDHINKSVEGVRVEFVKEGGSKVIKNIIGSYGLINGVNSYLAFIGDTRDYRVYEKLGYMGEACILEATSLGLDTCWLAGFFKKEIVEKQLKLKDKENIFAITPVGYSNENYSLPEKILKKMVGSNNRKTVDELCYDGFDRDWPEWIKNAIKAVRIAPSAANQQPWRFKITEDMNSIIISIDKEKKIESRRLDCGIAMLHIEIAALYSGVKGSWEYLEFPEIAVYTRKI
ncbi:MAG: nitroreductase family protein [Halanaerobiaceae bacterium]